MINTTNEMIFRLNNLNQEQERISYQMSTGKEIDDGSENTNVFSREIYIQDKINLYEGIQTQIVRTDAQNSTADSSMAEIKNLLTYAKAEILKSLNATSDNTSKEAIATNLEGLKDNIFSLVNEELEGEYLFAGSNSNIKPFTMDENGNVTYEGDGHLRQVSVEFGEYRDRGITGFDAIMYSNDIAYKNEKLSFSSDERVIDNDGNEWKLSVTDSPATGDGVLTKYDKDGNITDEIMDVTLTQESTATTASKYEMTNAVTQDGQAFEARHNFFNDLDNTINALRNQRSDGSATSGDEESRELLSAQLENITKANDGSNLGHAKLGGRNQIFEVSLERINSKVTQFNILEQEVSGADLSKVAMEAKALEMTYTALYSTINKMNNLSLVNFIN